MEKAAPLSRRTWITGLGALGLSLVATPAVVTAKERVIDIVARKFEFVPNEVHVALGESVVLQLSAPEVAMGFNLLDFALRTDILPGSAAVLRLTADKRGDFVFFCDVFCGNGHEEMSGILRVR